MKKTLLVFIVLFMVAFLFGLIPDVYFDAGVGIYEGFTAVDVRHPVDFRVGMAVIDDLYILAGMTIYVMDIKHRVTLGAVYYIMPFVQVGLSRVY